MEHLVWLTDDSSIRQINNTKLKQTLSQSAGLDSEFNRLVSDNFAPGIFRAEHKAIEDRGTPYADDAVWLCLWSGKKKDTSKVIEKDETENPFYVKEIKGTINPRKGRKYDLTIAIWNTREKGNEKRESKWKDIKRIMRT